MSRGLALTAGGVLLGAAVALALTRLLGNLLYKVSPRDPSPSLGAGGDDYRLVGSVFPARVAGHAHRSARALRD